MKDTVISSVMDFVCTCMYNFPIFKWMQGHIVINNAFMNWGKYASSMKTMDQLTLTNKNLLRGKWADKKVTSIITLGTIPSSKGVTKEDPVVEFLAHEWIYRMYTYYEQVRTEKVNRYETIIDHS